MKKFAKLISCGVIAMTLIISMQLCVMASVTTDNVSSDVASSQNEVSTPPASSIAAGSATVSDIAPYDDMATPNPRTGTQSLVIPGVVAILAAATAAVTLAGKKK